MMRKRLKNFNGVLLWGSTAVLAFAILMPVYWIFLSSVTTRDDLFKSPIDYIPLRPTLQNYADLFSSIKMMPLIQNTAIIIFFTLVISTFISMLAAYAFARIKFKGSAAAMMFLLATSMFPPATTVIPLFQLFRDFKLIDKLEGLTILYIGMLVPFTTWIMASFLKQLPVSLEEAAWVDGAGFMRTMFSIIFPLMKPAVATMLIINFILCMNEFMIPLIFALNKANTITIGMLQISTISPYLIPWERISALAALMLIPIILFIVIFERQIMEGLMAGGIKS